MKSRKNIRENRRKFNRKKRRTRFKLKKFILFVTIVVLVSIGANYFIKKFTKDDVDYISERKEYYADSGYELGASMANNNFEFTYYKIVDGKKLETKELNVTVKNKIPISILISLNIDEYLTSNKEKLDNTQIVLADMSGRIIYDTKNLKTNEYPEIRRVILGMLIYDGLKEGKIKIDTVQTLIKQDYNEDGYYFSKKQLNNEFSLSTLIDQGIRNNDTTSLNMLERLLNQQYNKEINVLANEKFKIDYIQGKLNIKDTIKISKLLHEGKEVFLDLSTERSEEEMFSKAIYTREGVENKIFKGETIKYDFGIIKGEVPYYFSIYSTEKDEKFFTDMGDVINRTFEDYYAKRNIYH